MSTHNIGDRVEVLLPQPFDFVTKKDPPPVWTGGYRIVAIRAATDRAYRVDVAGPDTLRGCCPTCVRAVPGAAA